MRPRIQHTALHHAQGEVNIDACFWTLEGGDSPEGKHIDLTLAKKAMGYNNWEALLESDRADLTVTDRWVAPTHLLTWQPRTGQGSLHMC